MVDYGAHLVKAVRARRRKQFLLVIAGQALGIKQVKDEISL
jgi:hypothetical protein